MDIASIPIVDFLKLCKKGAKDRGYYWIVCILSRTCDSKELYERIKTDWQSLDSITGSRLLVLFAGNENQPNDDFNGNRCDSNSCITDKDISYVKRYNPFATIIGNEGEIRADLSSVRHKVLQKHIDKIELTQTDAVQSLKQYFGIEERNIPCLVYIPLYEEQYPFNNIVVPIPDSEADLYKYFKRIFVEISPKIEQLSQNFDKFSSRIDKVYDKLISLVKVRPDCEILLKHISERTYYTCDQPIRGLLSQYIDLCRYYEEKNKKPYIHNSARKSDLLVQIETAFREYSIPKTENSTINACIKIGDHNSFKNSPISIIIQPAPPHFDTNLI